jgi:hypothetical protein
MAATKMTVDFDGGQMGQRKLKAYEALNGPADSTSNEDGVLTAEWVTVDDGFMKSVVEDYLEEDAVLEVHLVRMEE